MKHKKGNGQAGSTRYNPECTMDQPKTTKPFKCFATRN